MMFRRSRPLCQHKPGPGSRIQTRSGRCQRHLRRKTRHALAGIAAGLVALTATACAASEPGAVVVTATPSPAPTETALPPDEPPEDSAAQDAGAQDAGAQDAGAQDAGTQDAGTQDAGTPETNPAEFTGPVNPLTGLRVAAPDRLQRRPLAVKISNAPEIVRPQAGIGAADLVFEHYVEGSLTRFTAIFWSQTPPRVGSVRSARLIDLELPAMYQALFAYSGAAGGIRDRIAALPFAPRAYEGVTVGAPLYFRDPGIEAPHNLFVVPAEVWARADADGLNDPPEDLSGMLFDATPPAEAAPAAQVTIDYGPDLVQWDYDAETGLYARRVDGAPHLDANTGEQVTAANVVVLYVFHQDDPTIVESEWQGVKEYSIEIQLWTLGPVRIIRDGGMVEGYWMRWEEDTLLTFWADEAATEMLSLKPGNTWFQIVPLDFTHIQVE